MVLILGVGALVTLGSGIAFYNFLTAPQLRKEKPKETPLVSIMIPARDEEANIKNCLQAVLKQKYPRYEVLVIDDNSEDNTANIVKKFSKVRFFQGKPLPADWTGKNWALAQLVKKAKGDLYLFIDADVHLEPDALSSAVAMFQKKKVKMLSCFPKQKMQGLGEWLTIPIINWLMMSFVPLDWVYRTEGDTVALAIGQFMLFDSRIYNDVGGHAGVKNINLDDVELARRVKRRGEKIIAVLSTGTVTCRMYDNFFASIDGISRSFYRGAHLPPFTYVVGLLGIFFALVLPFIMVWFDTQYVYLLIPLIIARGLLSILSRQNVLLNILLLPLHGLVAFLIGLNSIYISLTNKIVWKGRVLPKV